MTKSEPARRLAYLYSRYPVVSQTFCDSEMLALEARGFELDIASINPPPSTIRHERFEKRRDEANKLKYGIEHSYPRKEPEMTAEKEREG